MPSFRSSRRVTGLKDSDYDHEINLVNHDDRVASPSIETIGGATRASTGSQLLRDEDQEGRHGANADANGDTDRNAGHDAGSSRQSVEQEQNQQPKPAKRQSALTLEPQTTTATTAPSIEVEEPVPQDESHDDEDSSSPDPSWEWAWPEWRVHRPEGVATDEFGWEYSFMFSKKFSWHGPKWWNSFVRRRCWVRKRIKKKPEDISDDPHMLNSDYFTVTPANHSRSSSVAGSRRGSISKTSIQTSVAEEKPDIEDVWTLMAVLRASRIDREKIEAVENYLAHAKDNLEHLQDEMHDIMGIFVFQASRRLLLSRLTQIYDDAVAADEQEGDQGKAKERKEHLAAAIKHADEEVKRLSYWSDVKGLAENGEAKHAVAENEGWNESWQGVDQSGPAHVNSGALPGSPKK
ncbi:meiotically up-regulated 65 protein [Colletotrichum tofieldiae]|nr:meiotically up-regulated 65 protein [Colletotrichum tofieldiae]